MSKVRAWIPHIETFVDSSRPPTQQAASLDTIFALLKNDLLTIEQLVRDMEMYLTTTDHALRARGILLLAELLTHLISKPLDDTTIHSLIGFFTSRLADWQGLRGALIGCLALLRRKGNVGMVVVVDAKMVVKSYLQNLQVQSLALHDRKLCFELLECLLDCYADAVVPLGEELIYGLCEAIDEEKDPQCLFLTFHLVEILGRVFPDQLGPISHFAGDLFDILGRYFPIYFTHTKNDELDVKRDDLSRALMHAFASTPAFEPFAIPLLLDKLSSSLSLAKLDSLKYLSYCSLHYGVDRMAKHAKVIWSSLKDVICTFSPQEPSFLLSIESPKDISLQENEVLKEAILCLERVMVQFNSSNDDSFITLIVEDDDMETNFQSITTTKSFKDLTVERWQKLHALGSILSVAAKVSSACCDRVFKRFFTRLMDILGISLRSSSVDWFSNNSNIVSESPSCGALYLCIELLAAFRNFAVACEEFSPHSLEAEDSWWCLFQNFSSPIAGALESFLMMTRGLDTEDAVIYSSVKGLQILAMFPGSFMLVSKVIYENVLVLLMSLITGRWADKLLWKLAVEALMHIGTYVVNSEKGASYMNLVVEKAVLLLSHDDSEMPFPMKLEAISEVGTTGPNFMMRVIQGLEEAIFANFMRAVEGDPKFEEILIYLLECYSSQVLPWVNKNDGSEEVVKCFALNIWDQLENNMFFNVSIQQQGLLEAIMIAMRMAIGECTVVENQDLIVQKAYRIVSSMIFSRKESIPPTTVKMECFQLTQDSVSYRDEWLISLFASVVIALQPQTPIPELREVLKLLTVFLLKGHVPAAQALGSMINKWHLKTNAIESLGAYTLEDALDIVLEEGLFSVLDKDPLKKYDDMDGSNESLCNLCMGNNSLLQTHAIVGLAWIGKGLVMRGHEKVKEIIMLLLKFLLSSSSMCSSMLQHDTVRNGDGCDTHTAIATSAADAFHVILSDSDVCLNKRLHATIRPLYKQHFFSSVTPILLSSIKDCNSSATRSLLYRAFGHVISDAPLVAVITEAKKLLPSLLNALATLSLDILNKDLTYSLLLVLSGILMDEHGKDTVLENVPAVITCLIALVSYPHMMLVRETAIQCLVAMSGLPHARIYPMRIQVLHAILKALDDPKRHVRQEAVRCRQTWASTASRSLHF